MWAKIDDALLDHRKILNAGQRIGGTHGDNIALGCYVKCLLWAAKHLTDGNIPVSVVKRFDMVRIAKIFVSVGLLDPRAGGYQIHDYTDWNASAADLLERRRVDRERKRINGRAGGHAQHRA